MKNFLRLAFGLALLWATPAGSVDAYTSMTNANYAALSTDVRIVPIVALSANRTLTLPSAGATNIGQGIPGQGPGGSTALEIQDVFQNVSATGCIVIAPQSGELINASSSNYTFCVTGGKVTLWPLSGTQWQLIAQGPGAADPGNPAGVLPASGTIGEYKTTTVAAVSATPETSTTAVGLMSLSLSSGDWDCYATASRNLTSSTSFTIMEASINTTSGTIGTQGQEGTVINHTAANVFGVTGWDQLIGPVRETLSATTSIFLSVDDTFSASTSSAYGLLRCRRTS
jgi:hypothetical protein